MSKSVEKLNLSEEDKFTKEEIRINPTDPANLQQLRCNFGTGYGEDLDERSKSVNKFFPGSRNAEQMYSLLGRSGVRLSKICLGSLNFGALSPEYGTRPGQLNEMEAHEILNRFVELGGNCIDTGNFYPWFGSANDQMSETIIGSWLKNVDRNKIFLITKCGLSDSNGIKNNDVNSYGTSRMNLFNSVEASLERLQTNHIDLLQLNAWDPTCNVYEVVKSLDELVKSGRVRYFGVMGFKGYQLQKLLDASRMLGIHRCICYDGEYNLLTRGIETEVAEVCWIEKIGFMAHSPLKCGLLSSNYDNYTTNAEKDTRIGSASTENLAAMSDSFEKLKENPVYGETMIALKSISEKNNLTVSQVAIMWALSKRFVNSVIVSVSNVQELEENMSILTKNLNLSFQDLYLLNNVTQMNLTYPNQISLVSIHDIKDSQEANAFSNISLLPIYLGQHIFGESHNNRLDQDDEEQEEEEREEEILEKKQEPRQPQPQPQMQQQNEQIRIKDLNQRRLPQLTESKNQQPQLQQNVSKRLPQLPETKNSQLPESKDQPQQPQPLLQKRANA